MGGGYPAAPVAVADLNAAVFKEVGLTVPEGSSVMWLRTCCHALDYDANEVIDLSPWTVCRSLHEGLQHRCVDNFR